MTFRSNVRLYWTRVTTQWRYAAASRHWRRTLLLAVGLLLLAGMAWVAITALLVERRATDVQARLSQVRVYLAAGKIPEAERAASRIPGLSSSAHSLTTGPAWWVAAHIPYLGKPASVIRTMTTAFNEVGSGAVPRLLTVASTVDPNHARMSGSSVDLAALNTAHPTLHVATRMTRRARARIVAISGDAWLPQIDERRRGLVRELDTIGGYLDAADRATGVLPRMLGENGTKTYFIGLQNESEVRGTGGLPGAFAILQARQGRLRFTGFHSDAVLTTRLIDTGLGFGAAYRAAYGASDPTRSYVDSNVSPNFSYAARIWAEMWERSSGQRVDGVLAVDPTVLSYILGVVGNATTPQGQVITRDDVVPLTERYAYTLFPNNQQRKNFLIAVLRASATRLLSGAGSAIDLVDVATRASNERRLLVWSRDPVVERAVLQTGYAGNIVSRARPVAGPILNNAAGGKLDYYLARSFDYQRTGCGSMRDVVATVELSNNAPTGLPPYVSTRIDRPPPGYHVGDNRLLLDYYATRGAQLLSVSLNRRSSAASTFTIDGATVVRMDVEIPRGTTQRIQIHLREPARQGALDRFIQPGVSAQLVRSFVQSC